MRPHAGVRDLVDIDPRPPIAAALNGTGRLLPSFEYRTVAGEVVGPLDEPAMRAALAAGTVSTLTIARASGDASWRPLGEILPLAAPAAAPEREPPRPRVPARPTRRPDAPHPDPPVRAVAFVDLDPHLRVKRRLLVVPAILEAVWGLAIVVFVPSLGYALVFATLAGAALSFGERPDPGAAGVLLGTAFVLSGAFALVWVASFALFAAVKRDSPAALATLTLLGAAGAAGIAWVNAGPPGLPAGVPLALSLAVAGNGIAHLASLARLRKDGRFRGLARAPRRGATPGPGVVARLGAGWDVLRGCGPIAMMGCFVALAAAIAGPYALLIYLGAWAVVRRRAAERLLDAVAAARERLQRATDRRLPADAPDPILFLRSFSDDVIRTDAFGTRVLSAVFGVDLDSRRLEESLVAALRRAGPVIAVARPGHGRPAIGAARQRLGDDEWQAVVSRHIARAACIVLVQGQTEGLGWELGEIRRQGRLDRLVLVVPPNRGAGMEDLVRAWSGRAGAAVPEGFVGPAPPLAAVAGRSASALEVCIASRRDAESYRLAARFCLDRVLARV